MIVRRMLLAAIALAALFDVVALANMQRRPAAPTPKMFQEPWPPGPSWTIITDERPAVYCDWWRSIDATGRELRCT